MSFCDKFRNIFDLSLLLQPFCEIEKTEPSRDKPGLIVTFKTRLDAEQATQKLGLIKFKERLDLKYSWLDEPTKSKNESLLKTNTHSESGTANINDLDDVNLNFI